MLNGVMLPWFLLTTAVVIFVAIDIRNTPESPVLEWGFVLLTAFTGPLGAFLYVLAAGSRCRGYMNNLSLRVGARRSVRPCIASPVTALGSWSVPRLRPSWRCRISSTWA